MKRDYIKNYETQLIYYKKLAEDAIRQISTEDLFQESNGDSNSIAIIMKHMAGNMLSRWTDIFNSDGEKPWRDRDDEFVLNEKYNYNDLLKYWTDAWTCLFSALDGLEDKDLSRIVFIRNMGHSVQEAIIRQLCHYSYHIGQIVFICKDIKGTDFKSLSIPKGNSLKYNDSKFSKQKSRKHFTDDL